jgi:hypothetical protein
MWTKLKKQWREFRQGRPGNRFQGWYQRNRRIRGSRSLFWRLLQPCAGIVLILGGIVLCFIPGPGLPLLIMGAGLLAGESRIVARAMDGLELGARRAIRWGMDWWSHASAIAKIALSLLALCALAGAAYGAYNILF